jgi:hypothetical protein
MTRRTLPLAALAGVVGLFAGGGRNAAAQQPHDHSGAPAAAQATPERMKMHDQMMTAMKAREERLNSLVKTMDGATGNAKIEAMSTIIRELVRDQKDMHGQMVEMHQHMGGGAATRQH